MKTPNKHLRNCISAIALASVLTLVGASADNLPNDLFMLKVASLSLLAPGGTVVFFLALAFAPGASTAPTISHDGYFPETCSYGRSSFLLHSVFAIGRIEQWAHRVPPLLAQRMSTTLTAGCPSARLSIIRIAAILSAYGKMGHLLRSVHFFSTPGSLPCH